MIWLLTAGAIAVPAMLLLAIFSAKMLERALLEQNVSESKMDGSPPNQQSERYAEWIAREAKRAAASAIHAEVRSALRSQYVWEKKQASSKQTYSDGTQSLANIVSLDQQRKRKTAGHG